MVRKFVVLAAALAAFAFTVQAADAHSHKKKIDPRLTATSIGVGAAATAGYFALNDWKWHWTSPHHIGQAGAWGLTTLGCAAVSPIVATAVMNRPLSYREAHILIGSCIVPIVGGWLVNEAYNNGTLWAPDEKPAHKHRHHKK
jgi:peptidoglycan/LPS O-acetylase OafA/YrhL